MGKGADASQSADERPSVSSVRSVSVTEKAFATVSAPFPFIPVPYTSEHTRSSAPYSITWLSWVWCWSKVKHADWLCSPRFKNSLCQTPPQEQTTWATCVRVPRVNVRENTSTTGVVLGENSILILLHYIQDVFL